jgi:hypothetical protein
MGQYQQWLFAQEIDRRLKAEVETLETELLYLRDRIAIFEQALPERENVILQALLAHLRAQAGEEQQDEARSTPQAEPGWNALPRLETPRAANEEPAPYFPGTYSQVGRTEDMLAFFDPRGQTDPRFPAWLQHERGRATGPGDEEHQVDEETRRLNESIRRWFERWHRQATVHAQPEGIEHEQ